jgi:outer membrane protein
MKKLFFSAFLMTMLLVGAPQLFAQTGLKIGYTEPNLILMQMPEYKLVLDRLNGEYQSSNAEIQLKERDFQSRLEDYQRKSAFMSDSTKAQTERELLALQAELEKMQGDKSQQLEQKQAEMVQPLLDKIGRTIDEVAKEKGFDFIFSTRAGSAAPILLYAKDEKADITLDVLKKMGINPPPPATTPAANTPAAKPAGNTPAPAPRGNTPAPKRNN